MSKQYMDDLDVVIAAMDTKEKPDSPQTTLGKYEDNLVERMRRSTATETIYRETPELRRQIVGIAESRNISKIAVANEVGNRRNKAFGAYFDEIGTMVAEGITPEKSGLQRAVSAGLSDIEGLKAVGIMTGLESKQHIFTRIAAPMAIAGYITKAMNEEGTEANGKVDLDKMITIVQEAFGITELDAKEKRLIMIRGITEYLSREMEGDPQAENYTKLSSHTDKRSDRLQYIIKRRETQEDKEQIPTLISYAYGRLIFKEVGKIAEDLVDDPHQPSDDTLQLAKRLANFQTGVTQQINPAYYRALPKMIDAEPLSLDTSYLASRLGRLPYDGSVKTVQQIAQASRDPKLQAEFPELLG